MISRSADKIAFSVTCYKWSTWMIELDLLVSLVRLELVAFFSQFSMIELEEVTELCDGFICKETACQALIQCFRPMAWILFIISKGLAGSDSLKTLLSCLRVKHLVLRFGGIDFLRSGGSKWNMTINECDKWIEASPKKNHSHSIFVASYTDSGYNLANSSS